MILASFARSPRSRAAFIHFGASVLVAALVSVLIFLLWYPGDYRHVAGGVGLFKLVVGVDVVLGPLMTLVVFDVRKSRRELSRDLLVVVLIQLAALGYGARIMALARPVVLALEEDRFRVVSAVDVRHDELDHADPDLGQLSWTGPRIVDVAVPASGAARSDATMWALRGYDVGARPGLWRLWDVRARQAAVDRAKPLAGLFSRYPARKTELEEAAATLGRAPDALRYVPVISRAGDWVALLDARTGDVLGFAPFDGF